MKSEDDISCLGMMKTAMDAEALRFEPLPDHGDHMTIEDFASAVKSGGFIDYDGHGCLATHDKCSNRIIRPSEMAKTQIPEWATHVMWFNR